MPKHPVQEMADAVGGKITEMGELPDGSGFAMMSMPLPKDHWSTVNPEASNVPSMPLRVGENGTINIIREDGSGRHVIRLTRREFAELLHEAGKYAYRCATMNGREPDLDPDALLQNLVVGLLGYWTADGLSSDEWMNPK